MLDKYIIIKSKENMNTPFFIDFIKGLLGNNIDIKFDNDIMTIYYSMNEMETVKDGLSALLFEYQYSMIIYMSKPLSALDIEEHHRIIKYYISLAILEDGIYDEHELLTKLVLMGHNDYLDKIVYKPFINDYSTLDTIKTFIETNMNTSKAASILYMHRNTLINKLDRFVNLTGYDVKKFKDAFIIYHLLKK